MTADEAQHALFLHWPGFMPQARQEDGQYLVRLVAWPPSPPPSPSAPSSGPFDQRRGELQARSPESYGLALLDLASFTPPMVRCRVQGCVLCAPR